jgi:16S rRNA (guanine527-N7)-methyltransferase
MLDRARALEAVSRTVLGEGGASFDRGDVTRRSGVPATSAGGARASGGKPPTGGPPTEPASSGPLTGRRLLDRLGLPTEFDQVMEELRRRYLEAIELGFLGPREAERLRERHLDDALGLAVLHRPLPGKSWADLGSGAGLPGLPLAAAFPQTSFTLLDSQRRRLDWAAATAASLGLGNLAVVHTRLEDAGRGEYRGKFDAAVARALGATPIVAELGLPLLDLGGVLIVPRGNLPADERALLTRVVKRLGGKPPRVVHNVAASVDRPGVVTMITKAAPTPMRFPRRSGLPQRQPLE